MSTADVAAIVLTVNQKETTLNCLGTVADQGAVKILVWDNGSCDGTPTAIEARFPQVLVHRHPKNLGVASGRNAAAKLAIDTFSPRYLLFLDNDMELEPGFVAALQGPFSDRANVGQTQAKLRFMSDRTRLNDGGGAQIDFVQWQVRPVGFGEVDRGQYDQVSACVSCGGAMMVRTDVFQQLGGFDTAFDPFGPEDLDFSLRLQEAGYQALYVPDAVAYHTISHTFGADYDEQYATHKARHWLLFMRRHASWRQKVAFVILGAPMLALRVVVREGKRGNVGALRGIVKGLFSRLYPS